MKNLVLVGLAVGVIVIGGAAHANSGDGLYGHVIRSGS